MVNGCFFNFRRIVSLEFIDMYFCFFSNTCYVYTILLKSLWSDFLNVFEKSLLCLARQHLFNKKSKNCNIVKCYCKLLYLNIF